MILVFTKPIELSSLKYPSAWVPPEDCLLLLIGHFSLFKCYSLELCVFSKGASKEMGWKETLPFYLVTCYADILVS